MKKNTIIYSAFCLCFILSFVKAEIEDRKGEHFIKIHPNIENDELREKLQSLRKEFNIEKEVIQEKFKKKMESIKESRKNEMMELKDDFSKRKQIILNAYPHKKRKKTHNAKIESVKSDTLKKMELYKKKKKTRKP